MKNILIKLANYVTQSNNEETDSLIESLIGETPSFTETESQISEEHEQENIQNETYQLPVQVGQAGQSLEKGDKPWIVGFFSPHVATDHNHPAGHNGVDLKASKGTPIYPIASGIVKDTGMGVKSGNFVMCLHENGGVQSFYAHMDSINVHKNQKINKSTVLGTVGATGNARGVNHTHFEVKVNGNLVNPFNVVGKPVGSLSKKAMLLNKIDKISSLYNELCQNWNQSILKKK